MLYVGLDLSRKRLDFDVRLSSGELFERGAVPPDADGLDGLVRRLGDAEVLAVIESMNGARFVHDRLELAGWDVRIADALKAKGLAPLACKTDKIDAWVLAELGGSHWCLRSGCPTRRSGPSASAPASASTWSGTGPRSRTASTRSLLAHGITTPCSDLFGVGGRRLFERLALPEPWRSTTAASLALIDTFDEQIDACERQLRRLGADHPYVPRLITCPGVAWILAFTIASEIGDIARFPTPTKGSLQIQSFCQARPNNRTRCGRLDKR
jgi:transposase